MYAIGSNAAKPNAMNSRPSSPVAGTRRAKRAQIPLAVDAAASDEEIARSVAAGGSTVCLSDQAPLRAGNLEAARSA
jgi:hypothetical protein